MEAISIIGFLVFIFTLFYLAYHFIRKIKQPERKLSKKVFYPILIGAFLFFIIGALFTDTGGSDREKLDETLAANESLSNEIIELNKNSKELQLDYDKLESDTSELSDEVIGLEDDIKELKDKYKKATEENETLEEEIETLTKTNKELQEKLSEKEASAKDADSSKVEATDSSKSKDAGSSKSKSTSEPKDTDKDTSTGSSTSESIDDNVSTSSDEEKDCDIKGSQNGIYHVPGSTYYSRTTNVEQWFCSTDEAEQAGYRAPER